MFFLWVMFLLSHSSWAQVPTITLFSPASAVPGSSVTLTGTDFNPTASNNIVKFGATQANVSNATATSLTVTVPAGATYGPITVLNTTTSLMCASKKSFLPTFSPNKTEITPNDILPKVDFATTGTQQPYYVAIGDVDGDGKPDLAVVNFANATVSVFRNISSSGAISSASFAAKVDFATGANPISVAIGDLDGDGKPELAVTNYGSAVVSLFRNTASSGSITSASFANKVDISTGTNPRSVAIGDLDGDGKPDLAIANASVNTISVLRNTFTASGTISFAAKTDFATGTAPHFVAIGDLDGDGKPDLATANNGTASASVLRNMSTSGNISFGANVDFTAGNGPVSLAIGDLDNDGKADLVVANFSSANVSVFQNTATSGAITSSSFAAKVDFASGTGAWSVAIGDLNGDGNPDLAVANGGAASVSVLRNLAIGSNITTASFAPKVDFVTATSTRTVAIGDLDLDGKADLVAANYTTASISIFRNNPTYSLTYDGNTNTGGTAPALSYIDITNTATVSANTGNLIKTGYTFAGWNTLANGNGTIYAASGSATFTIISNVTLYAQWTANTLTVTHNSQGGSAIANGTTTTGGSIASSPGSPTRAGYTFNGWYAATTGGTAISFPYTHGQTSNFTLYAQWTANYTLGNYTNTSMASAGGNATVSPNAAPTGGASVTAYTTTDFKGLLTVDQITGAVTITNAHPAGTYGVTVDAGFGIIKTFTLTVGNTLCSQGQFYAPAIPGIAAGSSPISVAVGDFNGDGAQDIAVGNDIGDQVSIHLGDGSGGFVSIANVDVGQGGTFSIAIGDFNGDGKQDFAAANKGSSSVSIRLGNGLGGFSGAPDVAVGSIPYSVAIGDFNKDGKRDMAIANAGSNSVSIRLGNGLGGFSSTTDVTVGSAPQSVAIGDFNGDGEQDFATANSSSGSVSIRLGDGLGGFSSTTDVTVGSAPISVAIGDFNGDGNQDIATSNYGVNNFGLGSASIRLGDGLGGFIGNTEVAVGLYTVSVATGDFNGDGNVDIATANSNNISIRLGNGQGGVTSNTNFNFSGFNKSIAIGDFNSDGVQDFVTTNFNYSTVSIRLGGIAEINLKGNSVNIVSGDTSPASADDTDFGFAVLNTNKTKTYTIENTGSGAITISSIEISGTDAALFKKHFSLFLPLTIEAGTSFNFTLTFKATNLGEKTAIVTINNNDCDEGAYIFHVKATIVPSLGNYSDPSITNAGGNATVSPDAAPTGGASVTAYTTTDFKGLLAVDQSTGVVAITNAHPAGTYAVTVDAGFGITKTFTLTVGNTLCSQGQFYAPAIPQIGVGGTPTSVAVGDFNGDGKQDIATSNSSNNNSYSGTTVSIRLGNGLGGFSGTTEILVGFNSMSLAIGDFNGDGKQDIAATASANSTGAGTVSFHLGDGLGGFSGSTEVAVGYSPYSIAISDFNGDGKQDIATANLASDSVSIRLGDGLGGFSGTTEVDVGENPYFVAIGDFNGDGKQDIATVNDLPASSFVSIRLGDGLGGFSGSTSIAVKADSRSLAIGDFNGDGKQDFAASSHNYVSIRLGDGLGGFSGSTNFQATGDPLAIGDFNGDGKQDIATCGYVTSIHLGDGQGGFSGSTQFDVGTHGDRKGIAIGDFNGDGKQDIAAANFESKVVSIRLSAIAEINLTSNSIDIPNGNTSIATADNTDFGNGFTITKTFTIQNTGTGLLTINSIGISGADASFFTKSGITLPTTIAPGIEANFNLNYTSTSLGTKTATVTITNDDCEDGSYTFIVQATSLVPTLGNYAAITIATAGGNASITPSAVPTNNGLGITATTRADFKGKLTVDAATGAVRVTNAHPAGTYQITVNAGFGVSETFILTVGNTLCSEGQFLPATSLNVGENPALTEIADFNNDGYQDFVVALTSTKAVAIRLGNGSGGFTTSTTLTFSQNINQLTVNDFNGDGNADIIIIPSTWGSIRLGDGSGGFTSGFDFYIGTTSSLSILSEDFDQDGKIDLAVNYGSGFRILKGNGQGGFNPLNTYSTTSGIQTNFIVKGDFNGDGFTDLSMGIPSSGDNYIYFGDGLGGFGSSTIYHLDSLIRFSTVGDFDGDGKSDILSALGNTPGTVAFQRNNGDGTFAIPTYIAVGDRAVQAVSGDFNGDGKLDFATGSSALSTVSVRYGNGDGTFYGTTELLTNAPAPASNLRLIVGDFNNDGVQDIGSANNTSTTDDFSIFLGASRDINLKGNAIDIVSGDNSPDVVDDTDFGPVALNTPTAKTYTIQNGGTTNLTIASISLSGVDAASFTVGGITLPAIIPGGNSTTFTITVNASTIGIKLADVIINSDDCDEGNYSFRVQRSGPLRTGARPPTGRHL